MTQIVNVKVSNIRPKYNDLSEWCFDSNNVYIARRGVVLINKRRYPEINSIWANPFKINKESDRDTVIKQYEFYIRNKLNSGEISIDELLKLKDKNLGCWCYPEPCHGDILIKLIKEYDRRIDMSADLMGTHF